MPVTCSIPIDQLTTSRYNTRMKIALDARLVYYRRYSGIGQYIVHLAEQLPGLDRDNVYTIIHSRKDHTPPQHPAAQLAGRVDAQPSSFGTSCLPARTARGSSSICCTALISFRRSRAHFKRVITVHDLNFLYYPQFLTAQSRRYYNDQIERAVQRGRSHSGRFARHPAGFDQTAECAGGEDHGGLARAQRRGVSPAESGTEIAAARDRLRLPDRFILFAGTLEPRKNVAGLLRAYRLLLDHDPHSPALILAGSRGWLFDETRALIDELHLSDRVRWIDSPPDGDLAALYNAATVFVLPSHYEGFGLTVLEAMACGAPCIISDRGSLPEIAGGAAKEVDPDDVDGTGRSDGGRAE